MQTIKLLIIEDSPEDRETYRRFLAKSEDARFVFLETGYGEEGLNLAGAEEPDCILLDYNLPDTSGLELLSKLRTRQSDFQSAVVMLTGRGNESVSVQAMKLGAQDYLVKSDITPSSLERAIAHGLEKVSLQREIERRQRDLEQSYRELARTRKGLEATVSDLNRVNEDLALANQKMWHQATHDGLTGLPNREFFYATLERSIHHGRRHEHDVAVLFIDLDRFKQVNDTFGHSTGDDLLRSVAQRLSGFFRVSDMASRISGDEFAVLLNRPGELAHVEVVAHKLRALLSESHVLGDREILLDASIGTGAFPRDGENAESLMAHADASMYAVKRARRR